MASLLLTIVPAASAVAPPSKHQRPPAAAAFSVGLHPRDTCSNSPVHFPQRTNRRRRRSACIASAVSGTTGWDNAKMARCEDTVTTEGFASLLEGVEVFDLEGKPTPLLDLWKDRKAVVGFARHFGCVFCRKRADLLASKKDLMDAAGVALAIIGPGSVEQAKAFYEQTNFKGEVYADPGQSSFNALNLVSGVSTTFTPSAGLKIIQLYLEGYRQDWELSFKRDTVTRGGWQQGGILVAGPGKSNILYFHKDREAGDDPDMQEVINACCSEQICI